MLVMKTYIADWIFSAVLCLMVFTVLGVSQIQATTYNWTPTSPGTYNWDNTSGQNNWGTGTGGAFPNAAADFANINVDFTGSNASVLINLNQTIVVGSLTLNDSASYYDASITLATGSGGAGLIFDNGVNPALLTATSNVGVGPPVHVISANSQLNSDLTVYSGFGQVYYNTVSVTGNIAESGSHKLTKTGAGNVVLSGTNSFTGGVDAVAGSVLFANAAALPNTGLLKAESGAYIGAAFAVDQANFIDRFDKANTQGTVGLNANTGNNISLIGFHADARLGSSGTVTYSGTLTPQGDTYRVGGGAGTTTNSSPGILTIGSQLTDGAGPRHLNMGASGALPAGTVILTNAANSFTGNTTVEAGILQISTDSNLGVVPVATTVGKIVLTNGELQSSNTNLILNANRGIALGPVGGSGTGTLSTTNNNSITYNGTIANNSGSTGSLTINAATSTGMNFVELGGNNTYTGSTLVRNGILRADDGVGLPSASPLQFNGNTYGWGASLQTKGSFTRTPGTAAGEVRFLGAGGFSARGGNLTVNLGNDGRILKYGSVEFYPSTAVATTLSFNAGASDSILEFKNGIDLNGGIRWFNVGGNDTTASSILSGQIVNTSATAGGIGIQNGAGLLVLNNDTNSFDGQISLPNSTHGGSNFTGTLGFTSIKNVGAGASALGAPTTATNGTILIGLNAGIRYLGTDPNGHSTDRIINLGARSGGGRVEASGVGKLTFTTSPTSTLAGGNPLTLGGTTKGQWDANIGAGSAGISTLTKADSGTWILTGTNAYSGTTSVLGGTLVAATNAPNGGSGAFGNATSDLVLGVANGNNNASILIDGAFAVGRNIRLQSANTTDAGTRVLSLGGNSADNAVFSGNVFLGTNSQAGRGLTLTAATGGEVIFSGVIQDPTAMDSTAYTITKAGSGKVILTNSNTYTGTTAIEAGTLLVNNASGSGVGTGNVVIDGGTLGGTGTLGFNFDAANLSVGANGGTLAPGASAGRLSVYGDVTLASNATFLVELDGTAPGVSGGYDQLAVFSATGATGTISLNSATLAVDVGFIPTLGQEFTILDNQGSTIAGLFSYNNSLLNDGETFQVGQNLFKINYNLGSGLNDVVLTFEGTLPVPEPSSLALWILGGTIIGLRRRNRQRA
jgi:autotransporter-associated beta strand protein